jgi:hypothetical protein
MIGKYRILSGDQVIGEYSNLITNRGRVAIGRYLAGQRSAWSDAIVVGAGDDTPQATDESLFMEFWREEIDLRLYESSTGNIVLRSIIPASVTGKIYELGVYCTLSSLRQISSSPVAIYFDPFIEPWSFVENSSQGSVYRIGKSSVTFSPAPSDPAIASLRFPGSFNVYTEETRFYLSYSVLSGTISSISVKIKSSDTTYREFVISEIGYTDYEVVEWGPENFDLYGNADWQDFSSIEVVVEGDGEVAIDALSVRQEPSGIETVLVSRAVLSEPIIKNESQELQIEYLVDLGINS